MSVPTAPSVGSSGFVSNMLSTPAKPAVGCSNITVCPPHIDVKPKVDREITGWCKLNEHPVRYQLDTGSCVTVIKQAVWLKIRQHGPCMSI